MELCHGELLDVIVEAMVVWTPEKMKCGNTFGGRLCNDSDGGVVSEYGVGIC